MSISVTEDGLTIGDTTGAHITVEPWDDGDVLVWIAPPRENDGPSVRLSWEDRQRLAEFLLEAGR